MLVKMVDEDVSNIPSGWTLFSRLPIALLLGVKNGMSEEAVSSSGDERFAVNPIDWRTGAIGQRVVYAVLNGALIEPP